MSIAGFGIIGPTGERLNTSGASPAEVQRLTQPQSGNPNPTVGQPPPPPVNEPTQAPASVRVSLSAAAQQATAGAPTPPPNSTTPPTQPEATQTPFAVQRAQNLYALNANAPLSVNEHTQSGARTLT